MGTARFGAGFRRAAGRLPKAVVSLLLAPSRLEAALRTGALQAGVLPTEALLQAVAPLRTGAALRMEAPLQAGAALQAGGASIFLRAEWPARGATRAAA